MSFEARIVSVPERAAAAARLHKNVGGRIVLDQNHAGTCPTHFRALGSATDPTHAVILEDDAIPCPDFAHHVAGLIAERPTHLLACMSGAVTCVAFSRSFTISRQLRPGGWMTRESQISCDGQSVT